MKLTIATHDDQRMAVIQEAAKRFRQHHPGVRIGLELEPDREALVRRVQRGEGPDIVEWEGANMGQCLQAGWLSDLSAFIERDGVDLEDYYPCIREAIGDAGRIGALPVMSETLGVFYNKAHFDEAGLSYPSEEWTWDDFRTLAAKLTKVDDQGRTTRYGVFASFGYMIYIEPIVWNNGGAFLGEDNRTLAGHLDAPETIEAFEQYLELIDSGYSPRLGVGAESWIDCFVHGKMSMYFDANWAIKPMRAEQREKFGAVGLPRGKEERKSNLFQVYGYGISNECAEKELAWSFLRTLTKPGGGIDKLWSVLNLAVSRTTAEGSGQAADPMYATFLEELKYGRNSAYQWAYMIPTFHHNETFRELRHASDAARVLREVAERTPALPPFEPARAPSG